MTTFGKHSTVANNCLQVKPDLNTGRNRLIMWKANTVYHI